MVDIPEAFSKTPRLSVHDFKKLGTFIHSEFGIKMPDTKRGMVESRLRKRLNAHELASYSDYCRYLFSKEGMENELPDFINAVTTNKTDFFREPQHFTFIVEKALPALFEKTMHGKRLNLWSCASSRGHEPYTLAMVLSHAMAQYADLDFSILATDISRRVLEIAVKGIYDISEIDPVPMELKKKYFLKHKDKNSPLVRVIPELRKKIRFQYLNLMDNNYFIRQKMDILFCRNVIIYFDKETTEKLLVRLCRQLTTGGFIFMGHSELLDCNVLPLVSVAPAVYQKVSG